MQYKKPPLFGVALYKYAWTLFKQQRYEAAVHEFVHLLNYTDEQQKLTGDPGADFRQEAFTYIAGSLVYFDFTGPGPDEPYIARPDVLDTAKSPAEGETKLRVAIDRVQNPQLVPQDKPWTIEIYKALALEFRAINQYKNALAVYQMTLDKWPMDPSAPDTQNAIAEVYDLLVRQTKVGDERHEYERKVLEARTALAKYIGDTPWVDANKDNPAALQRAEELVRTGLKGAAITHTRNAQAAVEQADQTSDPREQVRLTNYALQEYRLAALGWLGYLKQDENAGDAYKSRYFYADALHNEVRLEVVLHKFDPRQYPEPSSQEIATAIQAAVNVRDSDEDDQFIDNAGLFVVDLADVDRDLAFQRWQDSGGTQGVEPRKEPKLEGPEGDKKVVVDPIPDVIQKSILARDEYVQRVPPERDKQNRAADYSFYAAEQQYLYGHFKEAEARFQGIYQQHCGKDALGYEAWKRLIVMSNLQKNAARSRELAEAEKKSSCAKTEGQVDEERKGVLTDLVLQNAAFEDANKAFEASQGRQGRTGERRPVAQGRQDVRGRAPCRAVAQGRARRGDQLGVLLQAGRRVQQGHRPLPALHQQLRQRGHPRPPREGGGRSADQAEGRTRPRPVQGAHQVPGHGVRRPLYDVLRLLRLPARGRIVRPHRQQHALRRRAAVERRAHRDGPLFEPRRPARTWPGCTTSWSTPRCASPPTSARRRTTSRPASTTGSGTRPAPSRRETRARARRRSPRSRSFTPPTRTSRSRRASSSSRRTASPR